jgi:hypothetical protein
MSPIIFLATLFVAFHAYVYLKVVVQLRRKHHIKAYPQFEPCHPESIPPGVRRWLSEEVPRLERLGFAFAAYLRSANLQREVDRRSGIYIAMLRNEKSGDLAVVTEVFARVERVGKNRRFVAFTAELPGGASLTTYNTESVGVFKPDPRRPNFRFPGIADARFLYRIHRALLERDAPGRKGLLPSPGMEVPYLCESESRALMRQVECGYLYMDEARGLCEYTWKGALVMTGKLMFGVKHVLKARHRARARATLRSLGLKA